MKAFRTLMNQAMVKPFIYSAAIMTTLMVFFTTAQPVNVSIDTTLNETTMMPMATANESTDPPMAPERLHRVVVGVILDESWSIENVKVYKDAVQAWRSDLKYFLIEYTVFNDKHNFEVGDELVILPREPSPRDILDKLCEQLLPHNVTAIIYISNHEPVPSYGLYNVAERQVFQIIGYLGIPVIWWSGDGFGLTKKPSDSLVLQLTPSIRQQSQAMLAILERYNWTNFAIVTTEMGEYNDFVAAINEQLGTPRYKKFHLLSSVHVACEFWCQYEQILEVKKTGASVFLLHSYGNKAVSILDTARYLGMTKKSYIWILTNSAIGNQRYGEHLPKGTLGVHFSKDEDAIRGGIKTALDTFQKGLEHYLDDPSNDVANLGNYRSCWTEEKPSWGDGQRFYENMKKKNVRDYYEWRNYGEFNYDGTLKNIELDVLNLKSEWQKMGHWVNGQIEIDVIVWPGESDVPPTGIKADLKVIFLEEPPFVFMTSVENNTDQCPNHGVPCHVAKDRDLKSFEKSVAQDASSTYVQCCYGFSVDLMNLLAKDLQLTYEMFRVEDGLWGNNVDGTWNGLVAALMNGKYDVAMSAFKINSERQKVIDFTTPFMESAETIAVAKQGGIVSPFALLEPFGIISWLLILIISLPLAAVAIFFFEWCITFGNHQTIQSSRGYTSLSQTFWLVWAILFGASVNVENPRGTTARFMTSVWALFAVVLLAIYTANLTTYMITKEQYLDLKGINDKRLQNPLSNKPLLRFGTVPHSNTEQLLFKSYPDMFRYMGQFSKSTALEGVTSVKNGELDAFLYDSTVLSYLVGQDDSCSLLTVGSLYAPGGYGLAFPKKSRLLDLFNRQLLSYKENGDLERLQKFWMSVDCKPSEKTASAQSLSVLQFTSAFLLLSFGIVLALLLLGLEHIHVRYLKKHIFGTSTKLSKSSTFEASCQKRSCNLRLWKMHCEMKMVKLEVQRMKVALDNYQLSATEG